MRTNLSSIYTKNEVFLEKKVITKVFKSIEKMNNETMVYDTLRLMGNEDLAPHLLEVDFDNRTLYLEYCPKNEKMSTKEILLFAHDFHISTPISAISIYKNKESLEKWKFFLERSSIEWIKTIAEILEECVIKIENNLLLVTNRECNICLIHRDFRNDNIGKRNQQSVLYDFELAMWGDPLWDIARILVESDSTIYDKFASELYSVDKRIIDGYKYLYVASFLDYLLRYQKNDLIKIDEMLSYLRKS